MESPAVPPPATIEKPILRKDAGRGGEGPEVKHLRPGSFPPQDLSPFFEENTAMQTYSVTLPHYSVGPEAYDHFEFVARFYGKRVAVIGGETALEKAGPVLRAGFEKAGMTVTHWSVYGKDATNAAVERIVTNEACRNADVIFGVGGGRAVDAVKTAADILKKPFFTCPTVASNCAPVSAIAVIYNDDGSLSHYHFTERCPEHCFINTAVILDSPRELFWAGIGDALSKECEAVLSSRGCDLKHTPLLGVQVARVCEAPLLRFGAEALRDFEAGNLTDAFSQTVLDIIISTGIASNLLTTEHDYYFNSSLAHCFYNASMVLPAGHKHLHGEVVSFGVLVLQAADGNDEALKRLMAFNRSVGLPTTLADLDITSEEEVDRLVERAQSLREWTCVPYAMTAERYKVAILKVDALGRELA